MNIAATLLVVVASGAILKLGGSPEPSDPLKCASRMGGDSEMPETVVIIDHQPLDVSPSDWNHTDHDIRWVEIVCWSWVEEFYGVQVRNGAIYVLTDEGLEHTRKGQIASLDALIAAQDRHLRTHAVYARKLDELALADVGTRPDHELPEYFRIDLEETADGWGASVEPTERWLAGFRGSAPPVPSCYAFVGTPPDDWHAITAEDGGAPLARHPVCLDPYHEGKAGSGGG